ncbi:hypothetical protein Zmor_023839 [Zophobas morio]|uniref:Uncharacterized protein n=1 Tax=Zophobas morio TaxID=2755281 RepID=A0AA38I444_9CUCU|nr:hypothetical protein Zmor_023839 [Zophobas morio]
MSNNKSEIVTNEITQLLTDLKIVIHSLSEIATRLENVSSDYILNSSAFDAGTQNTDTEETKNKTSEAKNINMLYNSRNKTINHKKNSTSSKLHDTDTRGKKKAVTAEAFNQVIIKSKKIDKRAASSHVKDVKKKFEYNNVRSHHGSEESVGKMSEDDNKNKEIKVDVRSLKQKFELESTAATENVPLKINDEKSRRSKESGEKNKPYKTQISEEYNDKVKKILKYFQPQSS